MQEYEVQRIIDRLNAKKKNEINNFVIKCDYEIKFTKFSDMLTKNLEENLKKQLSSQQSHINSREASGEAELEMILGIDGCMTRLATTKQR